MAGLTVSWNERYEAALRAWSLVDCLPCGGKGYKNGKLIETEGGWSPVACTLCSGKGITHPPPDPTEGDPFS